MALLLPKPKSKKKTSTRSGTEESENPNVGIAKSVSHIDSTLVGFTGLLNKKQTKKFQEAQQQYQKEQLKLSKETNDGGKDKKTTKKWRKVVDFLFGGLKGFFKAIGKIVASLSLGKVTGILGFLLGLFLMLKLGLLDIVIPAALDLLETLVKGLIGYLPRIVKFLWKLISEYVPRIINSIADALSDALGIKSQPLRDLVKTLTWVVTLGAALNKVLGIFGSNIFSLAFKILPKLITFLGTAVGSVVGVVASVVAYILLVWRYSKEIVDFWGKMIDGVKTSFSKGGPLGKALAILTGIGSAILFTLMPIIPITRQLAGTFEKIKKLIKLIKKEGIGNAFKIIIHSVIQTVTSKIVNTFNKVLKAIKPVTDTITKVMTVFSDLGSKFSDMITPMLVKIKRMASGIGDIFGSILDWIMYKASYIPGVDIDRGNAGSSEEYHLMKYAESAAASESTRALINQYAYGNAEAKMSAASQMTDEQMQLAETFKALHGSAQSLKEFSADLNKNKGGLLSKATKKFNTSVNNTSEQSSGKR